MTSTAVLAMLSFRSVKSRIVFNRGRGVLHPPSLRALLGNSFSSSVCCRGCLHRHTLLNGISVIERAFSSSIYSSNVGYPWV